MSTRSKAAALTGALLIAATSVGGVLASSHREAPLIAGDPTADNTDLYAFVSPDKPDTVTIIANYIPLEEPAGGPNFFRSTRPSATRSTSTTTATASPTPPTRSASRRTPSRPSSPASRRSCTTTGPSRPLDRREPARSARPTSSPVRTGRPSATTVGPRPPTSAPAPPPTTGCSTQAGRARRSATGRGSSPDSATTRSSSTSARSSTWRPPTVQRPPRDSADRCSRRRRRGRVQHELDRHPGSDPAADQGSRPADRCERSDAVLGIWAAASRQEPDPRCRRNHDRQRPVGPGLAAGQSPHQRGDHPARRERTTGTARSRRPTSSSRSTT